MNKIENFDIGHVKRGFENNFKIKISEVSGDANLETDFPHRHNNIKAAYLHVIADALTSITAIAGLTAAWFMNIVWLDSLGAIISSFVIIKWSTGLLKDSCKVLLDIS